jgi:fibronectin type 3 domain-containing protein
VNFVETNLMTVQGRLASAPNTPPPADQTPPAAPAGVSATAVSSTQINVSWSAVTGAAGYRVYRDGATVPVGPQQTATTFSDTGLPPSSTHRYQVTAVDGAGNESALSAVAQATTQAAAGVPAAALSPTNLRFGIQAVGTARTLSTTVRNAGTAPLQISSIALSGAGAARYTTGGTCSTVTPVARAGSCTVTVTYRPTTRTRSLATLTVSSNAGRDTVAISGRGR